MKEHVTVSYVLRNNNPPARLTRNCVHRKNVDTRPNTHGPLFVRTGHRHRKGAGGALPGAKKGTVPVQTVCHGTFGAAALRPVEPFAVFGGPTPPPGVYTDHVPVRYVIRSNSPQARRTRTNVYRKNVDTRAKTPRYTFRPDWPPTLKRCGWGTTQRKKKDSPRPNRVTVPFGTAAPRPVETSVFLGGPLPPHSVDTDATPRRATALLARW